MMQMDLLFVSVSQMPFLTSSPEVPGGVEGAFVHHWSKVL